MGDLVKQGYNFKVHYTIPPPHSHDCTDIKNKSGEFVLIDVVGMEIEVETTLTEYNTRNLISVRFFHRLEKESLYDNNIIYNIVLTCRRLSVVNKCFTCDNQWHLIGAQEEETDLYTNTNVKCILEFEGTINIVDNGNSFAPLHQDEVLTDFSLRGEDGAINVHRAVLAVSSPVFQRMFCGEWKEKSDGYVDMPGMTTNTLQKLKDYLYLRTLPTEGVEQLLLLASYYMIPGLEQRCIDKLILSLSADNAYKIIEFAITNKSTMLLLRVLKRIQDGAIKVDDIAMSLKPSCSGAEVTTCPI